MGERMYAVAEDKIPDDLNSQREDVANAILEMDSNDVPWMNALEQLQNKPEVDIIAAKGTELALRLLYEL